MRGSRRRLSTFWLLAKVSKAGFGPRKPYHIATRWMFPSGPNEAMFIVWRSCRNASTSSSVMRISSRREGIPRRYPLAAAELEDVALEELGGDGAVHVLQGLGDRLDAAGSDQGV